MWKKTFKTIHKLSCFVGHPVSTIHPYASQNINKQIINIADENLTDYSFLSRYHYTKSKNYFKRRYRIRHWIPMFIGTPCIIRISSSKTTFKSSCYCQSQRTRQFSTYAHLKPIAKLVLLVLGGIAQLQLLRNNVNHVETTTNIIKFITSWNFV